MDTDTDRVLVGLTVWLRDMSPEPEPLAEVVAVRDEVVVAVIVGEFLADLDPLPDTEAEAL